MKDKEFTAAQHPFRCPERAMSMGTSRHRRSAMELTARRLWPAIWTMGNLGRAGYGGTLDGMWPYTYDSCDVGTLPNQTLNGPSPNFSCLRRLLALTLYQVFRKPPRRTGLRNTTTRSPTFPVNDYHGAHVQTTSLIPGRRSRTGLSSGEAHRRLTCLRLS